jgi:hypothetical protein
MRSCSLCRFAPKWTTDDPDEKGVCRWSELFDGPLPSSWSPWIMADNLKQAIDRCLVPVTRTDGQDCGRFLPAAS